MVRKATSTENYLTEVFSQCLYEVHNNEALKKMSTEEMYNWVSNQLESCGLKNTQLGSTWIYLTEVTEVKDRD